MGLVSLFYCISSADGMRQSNREGYITKLSRKSKEILTAAGIPSELHEDVNPIVHRLNNFAVVRPVHVRPASQFFVSIPVICV